MIISMFNKGNFERRYTYSGESNEPTLIINNHAARSSALIPLPAAYKYNEPEARNQKGMTEAFNMLRKVDQNQMLSANPDALIMGLLRIAEEDLQFGIALGIFRMAISLGVSLDNTSLFNLREYIADGLDDLVKMKPFVKEKRAVAEFDAYIDGEKLSGEMTE